MADLKVQIAQVTTLKGGRISTVPVPTPIPTPTAPGVPNSSAAPKRNFGVLGVQATGPMSDLQDAGCNLVILQALWDRLQPGGPGALDPQALTALQMQFQAARATGLKVVLEIALHYPPAWVKATVPRFVDQNGNRWTHPEPGRDIRDWFTQQVGRDTVAQFVDRLLPQLPLLNSDWIRVGGGNYGELSYPLPQADPHSPSFWSFGGVRAGGRASDIPDAPGTDTTSPAFLDWHLNITVAWMVWQIRFLRRYIGCRLYVMHPSWQLRQGLSAGAYREQAAEGCDAARQMDAYKGIPNVHPWCTWIDGQGWSVGGDTPQGRAPWANLLAEARARGLDAHIMGENTSETSGPDVLARVLAGPVAAGYGLVWLNYRGLTSGSTTAVQLEQLSAGIKTV